MREQRLQFLRAHICRTHQSCVLFERRKSLLCSLLIHKLDYLILVFFRRSRIVSRIRTLPSSCIIRGRIGIVGDGAIDSRSLPFRLRLIYAVAIDIITVRRIAVCEHAAAVCGIQVIPVTVHINPADTHRTALGIHVVPAAAIPHPAGLHVSGAVHTVPGAVDRKPGRLHIATVRELIPPTAAVPIPTVVAGKNRRSHQHGAKCHCRRKENFLLHLCPRSEIID